MSGVICPLIWVMNMVTLLITPLITTHEPPSRVDTRLGVSEVCRRCSGLNFNYVGFRKVSGLIKGFVRISGIGLSL